MTTGLDANLLAVTPDLAVEFAPRLVDADGPMLEQGLKAFHGARINLPRRTVDRPSLAYLDERYAVFRRAA